MFIDTNEQIKVTVYYLKKGYIYDAYTSSEFELLKLRDSEKTKYKELNLVMRQLTWGLQNELQDEALRELPDGTSKFQYKIFKEAKIEKTIISWDAKNEKDEPIDINLKIIRSLAPEIAEAIIRAYDTATLLGGEDEKK